MNHPMFSLYYDDYMALVYKLMPVLRKFGYDLYFSGLEQQLSYSNFPLDSPGNGRTGRKISKDIDKNTTCWKRSEFFPRGGPEKKTRMVLMSQGEYLNQFNSGAAGKATLPICKWGMEKSHGNFVYGESRYNGFMLVHVTRNMVDVKLQGVQYVDLDEDLVDL